MSQKQRKVFVEVSCDFCGLKFQKYIKWHKLNDSGNQKGGDAV